MLQKDNIMVFIGSWGTFSGILQKPGSSSDVSLVRRESDLNEF